MYICALLLQTFIKRQFINKTLWKESLLSEPEM
jgi:hypothetical protein